MSKKQNKGFLALMDTGSHPEWKHDQSCFSRLRQRFLFFF